MFVPAAIHTDITKQVFQSTGGFVLHKVRLEGVASKLSAWYDKDGKLLDCCYINAVGNHLHVNRRSPMRRALERLGVVYR